jgi:hypothetical protein
MGDRALVVRCTRQYLYYSIFFIKIAEDAGFSSLYNYRLSQKQKAVISLAYYWGLVALRRVKEVLFDETFALRLLDPDTEHPYQAAFLIIHWIASGENKEV